MSRTIYSIKPIDILLVEDEDDAAEITMDTLREGRVHNQVHRVEDGDEALGFLRQEGLYAGVPRPDLILLDLNMPRMNGLEVLEEIKKHPDWKRIPVVIMTSSSAERDVMAAYNRHANCFVTKPLDLDQFMEAVRSIEDFWLTVVRLPAA